MPVCALVWNWNGKRNKCVCVCVCVSLMSFVLADNAEVNFNNLTLHDLKREELSLSALKG